MEITETEIVAVLLLVLSIEAKEETERREETSAGRGGLDHVLAIATVVRMDLVRGRTGAGEMTIAMAGDEIGTEIGTAEAIEVETVTAGGEVEVEAEVGKGVDKKLLKLKHPTNEKASILHRSGHTTSFVISLNAGHARHTY